MAILRLSFLLALVVGNCSGNMLGMGIEVKTYNLLGTLAQSGMQIFAVLPKQCLIKKPVYESRHTFTYYKTTQSFYSSVGTSANIGAKLKSDYTLGFTLDMASGSVSGESRMVTGDSLQIAAMTSQDILQTSCLYDQPLHPMMIADLAGLPTVISEPWKSAAWQEYDIFLTKYGSHVVSAIIFGSSINQMSFADESKHYDERTFEVASCVALMGPTEAGMANISACSGITKEEIDSLSQYSMTSTLSVNGGTSETRNDLLIARTDDLILKFLNEANTTRAPIFYKFTPIWEIIQAHSNSTNGDLIKSVNMEQYYTGYLSYGCDYQETLGMEMQKFDLSSLSTPNSPRYDCTLAPEGCHSNDDCHYRLVKCKCEGNKCVRYYNDMQNDGSFKNEAKINQEDKWYWHGCDWKVRGSKCECKSPSNERYIVWSGDNKADVGLNHQSDFGRQAEKKEKSAKKKQEL